MADEHPDPVPEELAQARLQLLPQLVLQLRQRTTAACWTGPCRTRADAVADSGGADSVLVLLANTLLARHRLTGERDDLDDAIALTRKAAVSAEAGGRWRVPRHFNLHQHLLSRFESRADPADLDDALAAIRQSVAFSDEKSRRRNGRTAESALAQSCSASIC